VQIGQSNLDLQAEVVETLEKNAPILGIRPPQKNVFPFLNLQLVQHFSGTGIVSQLQYPDHAVLQHGVLLVD
jgi:hypothetical protein